MMKRLNRLLALGAALFAGLTMQAQMPDGANRTAPPEAGGDKNAIVERATRRRTLAQAREAAAARTKVALQNKGGQVDVKTLGVNPMAKAMVSQATKVAAKVAAAKGESASALIVPGPGFQLAQPDYMFGTASNWHNTKPIRKFVDTLAGLGPENANNLGNYIPVATPKANPFDTTSDYYEIGVVEYKQQLHSELAPTKLRGYQDLNAATPVNAKNGQNTNYLGPVIIAKRDRAVRVKMVNMLPTGAAGDLFLPVDTTMMGAGVGPNGGLFTQNRAELHLHGGLSPWISDGTPHQWVTPAHDTLADGVTPIPYPKGAVFQNVPDMATGANSRDGVGTYYWTNQQSGRFMFYHDHSFGLTRLNVYAGEAAGYLIVDPVEERLINAGLLPNNLGFSNGPNYYNYGIPLVIQDKTFVDTTTLGTVGVAGGTDPTWDVNKYGGDGSLWYPHVYMTNQNPADISGANAMGRWDYGAWFWPPLPLAVNNNGVGLQHGAEPVPNDPNGTEIPGTPNPSLVPEAFMDTPVVNGVAYPSVTVEPKAYRFRILNASNDRFWNLSIFQADAPGGTEVPMVPSAPNTAWPATWPTDGRDGGVPDPAAAGPSFIQIGNESGFLPSPVVIAPQPIGYNYNRRDIVVLNVQDKALFLGPAERADVIVDFSAYAGKTLILYNDGPAPVPAFDSRLDYYTGDPDQTDSGGAATTQPGYGPNIRTIMQINVAASAPAPAFDLAALSAAFVGTDAAPSVFAESQHPPIVPQLSYNSAMNKVLTPAEQKLFTNNVYVRIQDTKIRMPFPATENGVLTQPSLAPKAIQELFELDYGRMNATLGVELPLTNFTNQTTIPLGYSDPATENLTDGTTQYWKITHNGVDTHPVHFHLFDVQVINRVGWDGAVRLPDANEIGWKETVKMNPLEDIIVAFRPLSPRLPFHLPNSRRLGDVTKARHEPISWTSSTDGNTVTGTNELQNFGWEYVWHCHILGHEENDFMRPMVLTVATTIPRAASALKATLSPTLATRADLVWQDNSTDETGFAIQRRTPGGSFTTIATVVPNVHTFTDFNVTPGVRTDYRIVAYNQAGEAAPTAVSSVNITSVQVSGTISGVPAGVTVTLAASTGQTATAAADGTYAIDLPYPFTGTLTPSANGLIFTPASRTFNALSTDQAGQNFAAQVAITGLVTFNGNPLPGVTLNYPGGRTTTGTDGRYTLAFTPGWSGTITPSRNGYTFTPPSTAYAAITASTVTNYTAISNAIISGRVYIASNPVQPLNGIVISFSNGGGTALTDSTGQYSQTVPAGWSGTATATAPGYLFTPASRTFFGVTTPQTARDFVATIGVIVTGKVSNFAALTSGGLVQPVSIRFGNLGSVLTSTLDGSYSFTVNSGWTGTITPSLNGHTFTAQFVAAPGITAANNPARDFTAFQTISGRTRRTNGTSVNGVQVSLLNAGTPATTYATVTTSGAGDFSFQVPAGWSGSLTASGILNTWTLVTGSSTFNLINADATGLRFNGQ
ncbi:multicopper oxidase domain-containing protein [Geothrix sp. PMB-07]|uniref:multicopper oxidase domain-containing protein n=1 Tax=Geothrix sp. PMB-07 TaxID=3068640 RepID=UPI002741B0D3|nr:multicopper oxidase domain-containing protein [Geothrix sp. PMB-07]WLT32292.1 multicopper oxidase domain-containing protein [Geothrix sp. PMB-07]